MDEKEQLFGLVAVAQQQQKAAQIAIDGLTKQQAAIDAAAQGVQKAASNGARAAVNSTMSDASIIATEAFRTATTTAEIQLRNATEAAYQAATALDRATKSIGWKWAGVVTLALLGCLVVFALASWASTAWMRDQVDGLKTEKSNLVQEVARLKANAGELAKIGGKATITTCGNQRRVCIQVDRAAGEFQNDFAIIKGY